MGKGWIRRRTGVLAITVLGLTGAACDLDPIAALQVNTTADGADAVPGDGVCEMTVGGADCSLRAAVDEGNASAVAQLSVPEGVYGGAPLTVTGRLTVNVGTDHEIELRKAVVVEHGGVLVIEGAHHGVNVDAPWRIQGTLVAARVSLVSVGHGGPRISVDPGGIAVLDRSLVVSGYGTGPTIRNDGWLALRGVLVEGYAQAAMGESAHAITSTTASVISRPQLGAPGPACDVVSIRSGGHNIASDASCGLAGPTDLGNTPPLVESTSGASLTKWTVRFRSASPALDAIPAGSFGCGPFTPRDLDRNDRPVDGDGDGDAACDIGPVELQ